MGAFGTSPFDDDGAMDWLAGFAERPTLLAVRRALAGFPRRTEGEVFLAAAEVLAALRGWPREDAPPDVVDWAEKQRRKGADLQAALDEARRGWAALPGCELAALWAESPEQAAWLASVDELRARLEGTARPAAEPLPRRGPSVVLTLAAGEPAVRRRVSQLGALAGAPSRIQVDLGEDWTDDERAAVVGLCAPRERGGRVEVALWEASGYFSPSTLRFAAANSSGDSAPRSRRSASRSS